MRCNRRHFLAASAATLAFQPFRASALTVRGVEFGLQTYTFHQVQEGGLAAVDTMIAAMRKLDISLCELWSPQAEPFTLPEGYWRRWLPNAVPGASPAKPLGPEEAKKRREAARAWRINPPADYFPSIRQRFREGRIKIFAYNYSFTPAMKDDELEAGFLHAKALGVDLITASGRVSDAKRVVPIAKKHGIRVAFHNHTSTDPDEVSSPESFREVLALSPLFRINLDVAHFAAGGHDAVAFLKEQHMNITNLHMHDRKANAGDSVPFGEGVAPAQAVLRMLRDNGWKIPVFYELEYVGGDGRDVIAETARELAYERKILES